MGEYQNPIIKHTLDEIDDAIGLSKSVNELELMRALVAKAESWRMRLQELEADEEDNKRE